MQSTDSRNGGLWKLLVEGRAPELFFQHLFVRAPSIEDAIDGARQYLERDGSHLVSVDEEETETVTLDQVPAAWVLPSPTPEG